MQLGGSLIETEIMPMLALCGIEGFPPPQLMARPRIRKIPAPHRSMSAFCLIEKAVNVLMAVSPKTNSSFRKTEVQKGTVVLEPNEPR
jgi:hypothetical protein